MSTSKFARSANGYLSPCRIQNARMRRGLTKVELARRIKVTARTLSTYETEGAPMSVARALADSLDFPVGYFERESAVSFAASDVSFRAARRATARQREAAVAAGVHGVEIDRWISHRFVLPTLDLPMFSGDDPRTTARLLRSMWGLGTKPLPNLVQLCESKGIRVYTLPPFADAVDAYSIWRDEVPYIFLARRKTSERIRFDLAHELGHLVLHSTDPDGATTEEREADDSIVEYLRHNPSVSEILAARGMFKVSALALTSAAHKAGRLTDWAYRQTCIELSQRGFRSSEPGGMANYEMSRVFAQVLGGPRDSVVNARLIASELDLPLSDVYALTFGVELRPAQDTEVTSQSKTLGTGRSVLTGCHLQIV
jgi:Zn-dependent peptidase ImmA (M78 family)/DNA-binding XRE family transcriptional regulator